MKHIYLFLFFFIFFSVAAQERYAHISPELKNSKLYAQDFKALGIEFTDTLQSQLDASRLVVPYDVDPKFATHFPRMATRVKKLKEIARDQLNDSYRPALYLKFISDAIGFGTFADEAVEEGQLVSEYTGSLVLDADCQVQGDYAIEVGKFYQTDAEPEMLSADAVTSGNFSRFINHSYQPNVTSMTLFNPKDGLFHLVLHAECNIAKGTQLFIHYGDGYWLSRDIEPVDLRANS